MVAARCSGAAPAGDPQPAVSLLRDLLGRLPALPCRARQPPLLRLPAGGAGHDEPGGVLAASRPALGGDGGDDPRDGASDLLQPDAALDRGHLEVPGDLFGRHRTGALRLVLSRLRRAPRWRRGLPALPGSPSRRRGSVATLAARRVHAAPRRLWHQDGTCADAHLEARCLWRGAGGGGCAARGRIDELRLPRSRAIDPDHLGGRRGRLRQPPAGDDRAGLDGRRGSAAAGPARSQAHARVLERRADGDPRPGDRSGRRRHVRDPPASGQQRARQGSALPRRRQCPPGLRRQDHRRGARRAAPAAGLGDDLSAQLLRRHRFASLRPLRERDADPEVGVRCPALAGRRAVPGRSLRGLRRHGGDFTRGSPGPATGERPGVQLSRRFRHCSAGAAAARSGAALRPAPARPAYGI